MNRYATLATSVIVLAGLCTAVFWIARAPTASAHCQVPCGIYDDPARIAQLREDATTIEKAVTAINTMAGEHDANAVNQAVRWVTTKEDHASHIISVMSEYFLTQKVKPVAEGAEGYEAYLKSLADHHAVMVAAMKCKQAADPATVEALKAAVDALAKHYQS